MKLICSKANLLHGVNIVSKAVPTRTTMAILECILIDASTNEIKLTANDMELGIETIIEGEIVERGVIALDAKIFSEIVRKLPDSEVVIESDASFKTTITCEKANFNIIGKSGDDFSYLPYIERKECVAISQFTLKRLSRQLSPSSHLFSLRVLVKVISLPSVPKVTAAAFLVPFAPAVSSDTNTHSEKSYLQDQSVSSVTVYWLPTFKPLIVAELFP